MGFHGAVTVIGGGTMGQGIATAALQAGLRTTVVDVDPDSMERARAAITRRVERGLGDQAGPALAGLTMSGDLEAAVADAAAVIEAVPEIEALKNDIFGRLVTAARPQALLVSNTSTMSIASLAEAAAGSSRVIGMHFFNPAHKMPLVEIVVADSTANNALDDALALAVALGKDPIVVRDVPGFVTSRLGLLLGTEAMRMVEEGVSSAGDIDKAMKLGYGHPMGPLELADLVGLDARLNNLRSMQSLSGLEQYRPPRLLEELVEQGHLGRKTGRGFFEYDDSGRILSTEVTS